jgi:hypothetical protein
LSFSADNDLSSYTKRRLCFQHLTLSPSNSVMGTTVAAVARAPRLSPASRFSELVDAWLFQLGATKPATNTVAAYRQDLEGVARRIATDAEVAVLHLEHLTKETLRAAFASWATDHAGASVLRAHSSWSRLFDFLVAEDLVEGKPMAAVPKPCRVDGAARAIRDPDAAARLLATAAEPDPRGRSPWPERDVARSNNIDSHHNMGVIPTEDADLPRRSR